MLFVIIFMFMYRNRYSMFSYRCGKLKRLLLVWLIVFLLLVFVGLILGSEESVI